MCVCVCVCVCGVLWSGVGGMSNKPEMLAVVAVVVVVYLPGVVVVVAVEHGMMGRDVVWRGAAQRDMVLFGVARFCIN